MTFALEPGWRARGGFRPNCLNLWRTGYAVDVSKDGKTTRFVVSPDGKSANVVHLQIDLLFSRVALGEHAEAVSAADAIRGAPGFRPIEQQSVLYRLACIYSLSAAAVGEVRQSNPLTDEDRKLQAIW